MVSTGALVIAVATLVFLIASALWAERRFARFVNLPMHYGFTLEPTRMGSRSAAIWLPTGILVAVVLLNALLPTILGRDHINGDPDFGLTFASLAIVAAQIFILWLHTRWARRQA
jgi:hypothetical protein